MKNLFNIFVEFITLPAVVSIIGILSFISAVIALIVAWRTYRLQQKSDEILEQIDKDTDKIGNNIQKVSKIQHDLKNTNLEIRNYVNKTHFQIERTAALNKYPNSEEFKEIIKAYQPFIFCLFDNKECNIGIKINQEDFVYKIKIIKNINDTPKTEDNSFFKFYFIQIIRPDTFLDFKKLREYEYSPIKDGELYACRFNEEKCSWILSQLLSIGKESEGFYPFYFHSLHYEGGIVKYAYEIIKYNQNNYLENEYRYIDQFFIGADGNLENDGYLFKLLKKDNKIFFTIDNSSLKKIYILIPVVSEPGKKFLIFENLRGYVRNENFLINLKNRILEKININNLPEETVDDFNYQEFYHIKIPLDNY